MIKKLILLLFLVPVISSADDTYDPATGKIHMPTVIVDGKNYGINMEHQGDLIFKVTTATPSTYTSNSTDTFDFATGILHMPLVSVGSDNFEVDMFHQGDLVFKVTKATPIKNIAFKFTTDYLNGKTLYNVYYEDDTKKWEIVAFVFSSSTLSAYQNSNPSEKFDGVYSITEEGYIKMLFPHDDGPDYVKAAVQTSDYFQLVWTGDLVNINRNPDDEYFYFDLQKAQEFIDTKNAAL